MKHKHAEMIKAKADNMELVVFERQNTATHEKEEYKPIQPDGNRAIWFHEDADYFLCLPQHKEVCLHYLTGGDVLVKSNFVPSWETVTHGQSWGAGIGWMREDAQYRIKPKKEKRWIGVFKDGSRFKNTEFSYETVDELKDKCWAPFGFDNWQFIEVEVEV